MAKYEPSKIEKKWQKYWVTKKQNTTKDSVDGKENKMVLVEFPYPSGNLHIGHWYAFALPDMHARYWKMKGYNIMYPIGFDAFGLPAENAALQRNIHPEKWTRQNIAYMTKQLHSMGAMFDFSRVVSTIDPAYYKWTQWMFLQMYEKGLAYRAKTTVNWCPKDQTVLANEQVVDGHCERCGTAVQQRSLEQWMMKTTTYADQLIDGLEGLDWPHTSRVAQKNWIGRSEGALIQFQVSSFKFQVEVFTTRPDTIFGVTFLVISPEVAKKWLDSGWQASMAVTEYVDQSLRKRELERLEGVNEKTGVSAGIDAIHPLSGEKIPVWIADYVLGSYGTGAIMAVPARDERDGQFAKKFNISISDAPLRDGKEIIALLESKDTGKAHREYKLRDWVLSRQRYWGVPIPIINCPTCGRVPVPDKDLPVKLPPLKDFKPADDGRSPLAKAKRWLKVKCPQCGESAERETDTMDTFVDSSWYYIRYADPKNSTSFADPDKMKKWLPVSMYVGGAEHNTMHLLYSRFFAKVLYDLGHVHFSEPFVARRNHGFVLGPDGQKMSKSQGNVVDPDKEVAQFGADTVRMYLAFLGPYDQNVVWDSKGINGVHRFLGRVWNVFHRTPTTTTGEAVERALHMATKKIGEDLEGLRLNTAVSELMKLINSIEESGSSLTEKQRTHFLLLLAPLAPHITEELWAKVLKKKTSIHLESWPEYDPALLISNTIELPVQVNGKVRAVIEVPPDAKEDDVVFVARAQESLARYIEGRTVHKIIYVPGKMLNIVIQD